MSGTEQKVDPSLPGTPASFGIGAGDAMGKSKTLMGLRHTSCSGVLSHWDDASARISRRYDKR